MSMKHILWEDEKGVSLRRMSNEENTEKQNILNYNPKEEEKLRGTCYGRKTNISDIKKGTMVRKKRRAKRLKMIDNFKKKGHNRTKKWTCDRSSW